MVKLGLALLATLALLVYLQTLTPRAAQAQTPCAANINGVSTDRHSTSSRAIDVDKGDRVVLDLVATAAVGRVEVKVAAGPVTRNVPVQTARGGGQAASWSGAVNIGEQALV